MDDKTTTKAQQRAVQKYVKNNYDRIVVNLPKGQRDEIKAFAASRGESVNSFVCGLISEAMKPHT